MKYYLTFALLLVMVFASVVQPNPTQADTSAPHSATAISPLIMQNLPPGMTIDPNNPQVQYRWDQRPGTRSYQNGFDKSSDGGLTWERITINQPEYMVYKLIVDPRNSQHLLATLNGQSNVSYLYSSYDGGLTWARLLDVTTVGLALSPVAPNVVYASEWDFGLWRSDDGGSTWQRLSADLHFSNITPDPYVANVVYARVSQQAGYTLRRSTDYGATWTSVGAGSGPVLFTSDPQIMYAQPRLRSLDGGTTWTTITNQFNIDTALYVNPDNPLDLYVNVYLYFIHDFIPEGGIWHSTDGGDTWTQVLRDGFSDISYIWMDPADSQRITATLFENGGLTTADGGQNWTALGCPNGLRGFSAPTQPSRTFFFAEDGTFYLSPDHGATCSPSTPDLHPDRTMDLTADVHHPNHMAYLAYRNGVAHSNDGGTVWITHTSGLNLLDYFDQLAFDPHTSDLFLTQLHNRTSHAPLLHTDGVANWQAAPTDTLISGTIVLDMDSGLGANSGLYVLSRSWQSDFSVLSLSADSGLTWQTLPFSQTTSQEALFVEADAQTDDYVYVATIQNVYRSSDRGQTWQASSSGIPAQAVITLLTVDPTTAGTAYVATLEHGLLVTHDGGATWAPAGLTLYHEIPVDISVASDQTVYVATSRHIYAGANAGTAWRALVTPQDWSITALASKPQQADQLLVGTDEGLQTYTITAAQEVFMPALQR